MADVFGTAIIAYSATVAITAAGFIVVAASRRLSTLMILLAVGPPVLALILYDPTIIVVVGYALLFLPPFMFLPLVAVAWLVQELIGILKGRSR